MPPARLTANASGGAVGNDRTPRLAPGQQWQVLDERRRRPPTEDHDATWNVNRW